MEKCIEETLTGDPDDPRRIHVEREDLVAGLAARHAAGKRELAALVLDHPESHGLDDGELRSLACLHTHEGCYPRVLVLMPTAGKAAIVATGRLGGLDSLVPLERLAQDAGVTRGRRQSGPPLSKRLVRRNPVQGSVRDHSLETLATAMAALPGAYLGALVGWRGAFPCLAPMSPIALTWQWKALPAIRVATRTVGTDNVCMEPRYRSFCW